MADAEDRIKPNALINGKYRIIRAIDEGGMGAVFEADQVDLGRPVALKVIQPSLLTKDRDGIIRRFDREAKTTARLNHPHICEVIDRGLTDGGVPYMVMPLLKGNSLRTLFNRQSLSLEPLITIIDQTLSALQAAHGQQVVHRDLKPENIFITELEDQLLVKLLDFGISKLLGKEQVTQLTATGAVLGTAEYMSPEQAMGAGDVDFRTDIYAAGVILYEGLTGTRPFSGSSYNELMHNIISKPFDAPRSINPSVPAAVDQVVIKAMARDSALRFQSAGEMRLALKEAIVTRESVQYRPPGRESVLATAGTSPGVGIRRPRRWRLIALVALAVIALVGSIAFAVFRPGDKPSEPSVEVEAVATPPEESARSIPEPTPAPAITGSPAPAEIEERDTAFERRAQPSVPADPPRPRSRRAKKRRIAPSPSDDQTEEKVKGRFGTTFVPLDD